MSDSETPAVQYAQFQQAMRQQKVVFERRIQKDRELHRLRLVTGYVAVLLLAGILLLCVFVLLNHSLFPDAIVLAASGALLVDALGVVLTVVAGFARGESVPDLQPTTRMPLDSEQTQRS